MEPITVYADRDLRTLERSTDLETLDTPEDELTGSYEYLIDRQKFLNVYHHWNRDENPLLAVQDELSHLTIYLGHPSAQRVHDAIEKNEANVQLF